MRALNITDKEIEWLKLFGDPAQLAKDAVYFFVKNKIEAKMEEYRDKCLFFEKNMNPPFMSLQIRSRAMKAMLKP